MTNKTMHNISIGIIWMSVLMCLIGCHREFKLFTDAVSDRTSIPVLVATDVTTLISDSGITRYRITAPTWKMFDKAEPPYWEFENGIYLEKFSEDLEVDASLQSDYAHYDEQAQIWHLVGNVHSVNLQGEIFDTPELFWNQKTERIYSDSSITIIRETSTIMGIGFESNQEMTKYTILSPTGYFPVKDE